MAATPRAGAPKPRRGLVTGDYDDAKPEPKGRFLRPVCILKDPPERPREMDCNESAGVWKAVFRQMAPADADARGPFLPFREEPMDASAVRSKRYIPEPQGEKDVPVHGTGVRRLLPPELAPDPRGFPTPRKRGGVARPCRRRADGRPHSLGATALMTTAPPVPATPWLRQLRA
eukprot:TRINITY_DN14903_c0_g1_i1.p2 TRINITY_DN14903_c0_g1~~TRINITY_DN14903_c0_g1_i1.p2  ORF type:complete len:202 (+),score=26.90 TRINITY_DN14903_c0_g1_i1:86-607(+)